MTCPKCNDSGWVCEIHQDKPFEHMVFFRAQCGGAGMPCICNTYNPPWDYPDKTRIEFSGYATENNDLEFEEKEKNDTTNL